MEHEANTYRVMNTGQSHEDLQMPLLRSQTHTGPLGPVSMRLPLPSVLFLDSLCTLVSFTT